MAVPLSAPDESIITHQVSLNPDLVASTSAESGRSIWELYDIEETSVKLIQNRFKKVALQFPDELLVDSVPVYWAMTDTLQRLTRDANCTDANGTDQGEKQEKEENQQGQQQQQEIHPPDLYILADTSYGNCCVDEVAAQHVEADVVVHYGHACLSPTSRLPVIYVFPKSQVDIQDCISCISEVLKDDWLALPLKDGNGGKGPGENDAEQRERETEAEVEGEEEDQDQDQDQGNETSKENKEKPKEWDSETRPQALILMYDVAFAHASRQIQEKLQDWLDANLGDQSPKVVLSRFETEVNFERMLDQKRSEEEDEDEDEDEDEGEGEDEENDEEKEAMAKSKIVENESDLKKAKDSCGKGPSCCQGRDRMDDSCSSKNHPSSYPSSNRSTKDPRSHRSSTSNPTCSTSCRVYDLPQGISVESCGIIYLGGESLSLTNILLTLGPTSRMISYDPKVRKAKRETGSTNRLLMKRYTLVQKAKDASVIGLLVGTLGIHSYLPLLNHLRSLLTSKGSSRKIYTISVGKLNPSKLANFHEIDLFVLIACSENSLVDSKEFYKPIVTPFEMLLALNGGDWNGHYQLDFAKLVDVMASENHDLDMNKEGKVEGNRREGSSEGEPSLSRNYDDDDEEEEEEEEVEGESSDEEPHFSLITGGLVSRSKYSPSNAQTHSMEVSHGSNRSNALARLENHDRASIPMKTSDGSVVLKGRNGKEITVLQSASGRISSRSNHHHLGTNGVGEREWKGLKWENSHLTGQPPAVLKEGREGIAGGYGELNQQ